MFIRGRSEELEGPDTYALTELMAPDSMIETNTAVTPSRRSDALPPNSEFCLRRQGDSQNISCKSDMLSTGIGSTNPVPGVWCKCASSFPGCLSQLTSGTSFICTGLIVSSDQSRCSTTAFLSRKSRAPLPSPVLTLDDQPSDRPSKSRDSMSGMSSRSGRSDSSDTDGDDLVYKSCECSAGFGGYLQLKRPSYQRCGARQSGQSGRPRLLQA